MEKNKIRQTQKEKEKNKFSRKDLKKSSPIESSLSKEDLLDYDENEDEEIYTEDENDDQSQKDTSLNLDILNLELPKYPPKIKTVLLILKGEKFRVIHYGFKGYGNDKETSYFKHNSFENFSKAASVIESYANGFYDFENPRREDFYERFKSEMLLKVNENSTDIKNKTNRHFLSYYMRFWDGVDVKISALTFNGKPNVKTLAMTLFRIGIGKSQKLKDDFIKLDSKSLNGDCLRKTNSVLEILNEILRSSEEKTFTEDTFFENLNKNDEFKNILKHLGGKNGQD
ncbi:hypothetical protein [Athalassotoga saccharophila]|uniref:hypothetical protein n=1 Tax=Athalassotoga saccharophila TaxID=1441386 RepID=UPI001379F19C|nr:hypothetical protein [Athalassotoga saccharophila]BBJ28683.1 hypothetical protein ATHSA_1602 [Athalassotoga saccharophila]